MIADPRTGPRRDAPLRGRLPIRWTTLAAIVVLGAVLTASQQIALGGIRAWQVTLAPLAARAGLRCRFSPTCSHYAAAVIARDGVLAGGWSAAKRIVRCNPTTRFGTVDEP